MGRSLPKCREYQNARNVYGLALNVNSLPAVSECALNAIALIYADYLNDLAVRPSNCAPVQANHQSISRRRWPWTGLASDLYRKQGALEKASMYHASTKARVLKAWSDADPALLYFDGSGSAREQGSAGGRLAKQSHIRF